MTHWRRTARRVLNVMLPGRVKTVNDAGPVQTVQIDHGPQGADGSLSVHDAMPRLAEFGFTSNPPADTDAVVVFVGGDRSNGVIVATGHKATRLGNLSGGDVAVYDARGAYVWFTPSGLVVDAAGGDLTVRNAGNVSFSFSGAATFNGDVKINGKVTATGDVVAGSVSLDTHVHGGVTAGAANTAGPH